MRLVCVCPNPAIDHTMIVPCLSSGETVRSAESLTTAGGKGLNVARFAQGFGAEVTAVACLGEIGARFFSALASRDGLSLRASIAPGLTVRVCPVLVCEADGSVLVASDPSPLVDRATWSDFVEVVARAAAGADAVCVAGSFPRLDGAEPVRELLEAVDSIGSLWVDTSGHALASAAAVRRASLKVNLAEAGELAATAAHPGPPERERALAAAQAMGSNGRDVVVTAGRAGAASSTAAGLRWQDAPSVFARNPTASGDAFMAGYLCAGRAALREVADPLWAGVLAGAVNARSALPEAPAKSVISLAVEARRATSAPMVVRPSDTGG